MAKTQTKAPGAVRIMWRTRPFLAGRLAVYSVFFFASIGFISALSFLFFLVGSAWLQVVMLLLAIAGFWLVRRSLRRHLGHVGHHPHIAAMASAIKGDKLAKRRAQVEESMTRVSARFPESNEQFALDGTVGKVVKESSSVVIQQADFNPFPGLNRLKRISSWILSGALQVVRSVLFGYALYRSEVSIWRATRQGLNLYAQMGNSYAKSLVRIYIWGLVFGLVAIAVLLIPGLQLLPLANKQGFVTVVILFIGIITSGWVIKRALYEPYALARSLSVFIRKAEGLEPSPAWDSKLYEVSKRFRDIVDRTGEPVARIERPAAEKEVPKPEEAEPTEPGEAKVAAEPGRQPSPGSAEKSGSGDSALAPTVKMTALGDDEDLPAREVGKFADELAELDSLFGTQETPGQAPKQGAADASVIVDLPDESGEKPEGK